MKHEEPTGKIKVLRINTKGRFAEDHNVCTNLRWETPPQTRFCQAPSAEGILTMKINNVPFVRFCLPDGAWSEPLQVLPEQPCKPHA